MPGPLGAPAKSPPPSSGAISPQPELWPQPCSSTTPGSPALAGRGLGLSAWLLGTQGPWEGHLSPTEPHTIPGDWVLPPPPQPLPGVPFPHRHQGIFSVPHLCPECSSHTGTRGSSQIPTAREEPHLPLSAHSDPFLVLVLLQTHVCHEDIWGHVSSMFRGGAGQRLPCPLAPVTCPTGAVSLRTVARTDLPPVNPRFMSSQEQALCDPPSFPFYPGCQGLRIKPHLLSRRLCYSSQVASSPPAPPFYLCRFPQFL